MIIYRYLLPVKKFVLPSLVFLFLATNSLAQADTTAPTLVCKNNVVVSLFSLCTGALFVNDVIDNLSDNAGLQGLQTGIRRACSGTGFPESASASFNAHDLGDAIVEVWARDAAGNTASCTANVTVMDSGGGCEASGGSNALIVSSLDTGIAEVEIAIDGYFCVSDSFHCTDEYPAGQAGLYFVPCSLPFGARYSISASKSANPLNGISTNDMVLMTKHLLGIQPFTTPWQYIAADVNGDGKVSTYDIVLLRKLILGIDAQLPGGKSWRFVPGMYVFPNSADPFNPPYPQQIDVDSASYPPGMIFFRGVKIGDVNFSADPGE